MSCSFVRKVKPSLRTPHLLRTQTLCLMFGKKFKAVKARRPPLKDYHFGGEPFRLSSGLNREIFDFPIVNLGEFLSLLLYSPYSPYSSTSQGRSRWMYGCLTLNLVGLVCTP